MLAEVERLTSCLADVRLAQTVWRRVVHELTEAVIADGRLFTLEEGHRFDTATEHLKAAAVSEGALDRRIFALASALGAYELRLSEERRRATPMQLKVHRANDIGSWRNAASASEGVVSLGCSMAGANPPWLWSWSEMGFRPFSEMEIIPCSGWQSDHA